MVYGCDDIEFELAVRRRLKDAGVNLDFLDTRSIEFFERCDDASLLACAGGSVYKEMGEITALCLQVQACQF